MRTASALREIDGVGEARVEKYGQDFLAILQTDHPVDGGAGGTG